MKINQEVIFEILRSVRPLFMDTDMAAKITEKGAADYVTEVDFTVQKTISDKLQELYPEVQFMGEEKDNSDIDPNGSLWILDPVDGTTNLIYDYKVSCVSLGYIEDGKLTFGAIYWPYMDEMFFAEKGKGAYLNGRPIHVRTEEKLINCLIAVGTSPYEKQLADANFELFRNIFKNSRDIRRGGSAAIDLAFVAAGRLDGFVERNLKPWDIAAGTLIVREAGGVVKNYAGADVIVTANSDICCGNAKVAEQLLELI